MLPKIQLEVLKNLKLSIKVLLKFISRWCNSQEEFLVLDLKRNFLQDRKQDLVKKSYLGSIQILSLRKLKGSWYEFSKNL